MKQSSPLLVLATLACAFAQTASAHTLTTQPIEWSPHIGIDYKYWGAHPKAAFDPIFPVIESGLSGYVGLRINQQFDLNLGYEAYFHKEKSTTFNGSTAFFGPNDALGDTSIISFRMKSYYLQGEYHYAIPSTPCVELLALLGVIRSEPTSTVLYTQAGQGNQLSLDVEPFWHVRYGFGVQYNFAGKLGLKTTVFWDQSSMIEYKGANQINNAIEFEPYKNATNFSIGLVLKF